MYRCSSCPLTLKPAVPSVAGFSASWPTLLPAGAFRPGLKRPQLTITEDVRDRRCAPAICRAPTAAVRGLSSRPSNAGGARTRRRCSDDAAGGGDRRPTGQAAQATRSRFGSRSGGRSDLARQAGRTPGAQRYLPQRTSVRKSSPPPSALAPPKVAAASGRPLGPRRRPGRLVSAAKEKLRRPGGRWRGVGGGQTAAAASPFARRSPAYVRRTAWPQRSPAGTCTSAGQLGPEAMGPRPPRNRERSNRLTEGPGSMAIPRSSGGAVPPGCRHVYQQPVAPGYQPEDVCSICCRHSQRPCSRSAARVRPRSPAVTWYRRHMPGAG